AMALDRRFAALCLGAVLSISCLGPDPAAVSAEIYRHKLLGDRCGAVCARQLTGIPYRENLFARLNCDRAYAQAPRRGRRQPCIPETSTDPPTDRTIISRLERSI